MHLLIFAISLSWFRLNDIVLNLLAIVNLYSCYVSLKRTSYNIYLVNLAIFPTLGLLYFWMLDIVQIAIFIIHTLINMCLCFRIMQSYLELSNEELGAEDLIEVLMADSSGSASLEKSVISIVYQSH